MDLVLGRGGCVIVFDAACDEIFVFETIRINTDRRRCVQTDPAKGCHVVIVTSGRNIGIVNHEQGFIVQRITGQILIQHVGQLCLAQRGHGFELFRIIRIH